MKYSLMTYAENEKTFNIGDYIQSLAAKQFMPQVDNYINREKLAEYRGGKTKLIMNGWFTHNTKNWIPSRDIDPLLISFHINNTAAPGMLSAEGIDFLKSKQPIGCRDYFTANLLKSKGVDAYFSGCLTLTLDSYKVDDSERNDEVYIVDPLYGFPNKDRIFYNYKSILRSIQSGDILKMHLKNKYMKNIFSEDLLRQANYLQQELPAHTYSEYQKFEMAEDLLHKYARAKLVITSRIHCALPCLALGTPVIYINGFDSFVDSCRLDGIAGLFNRVDINRKKKTISNNFNVKEKIHLKTQLNNPDNFIELSNLMKVKCNDFIKDM